MHIHEQNSRATGPLDIPALAPGWRRVKDAFYKVIATGAPLPTSEARASELRVLTRLAALRAPDVGASPVVDAAIADLASDFGRYVLAKHILEDSVDEAARVLATAFESWNAGRVSVHSAGVRRVVVRVVPGPALLACAPDVRTAFVTGVLRGVFTEAFNSDVRVHATDSASYLVRFGTGRNVNLEVHG